MSPLPVCVCPSPNPSSSFVHSVPASPVNISPVNITPVNISLICSLLVIQPLLVNSLILMHNRAVSLSLLDVIRATQTSPANTKKPTMQDKAKKIQETLWKILERIDTLIVVYCGTRDTHAPDAVQATVTAQLIANTAFTAIVACISSPAEKDQAVNLTLTRIQPFSTDEGHNICGVSKKKLPTPEKKNEKMRELNNNMNFTKLIQENRFSVALKFPVVF